MLRPGIYEQLIDRRLAQELDQLPENQKATVAIDQAEASFVLSEYVADVVRKALELSLIHIFDVPGCDSV